jgi:hypothetical protein
MNHDLSEEVTLRRSEELAALQAYYDDDLLPSLTPPSSSSFEDDQVQQQSIALAGPWFIKLGNTSLFRSGSSSSSSMPTLEIRLPSSYPFGTECPTPILHNVIMKPQIKEELLQELQDMYEIDMDVGIMWGERCREEICMLEETSCTPQQQQQQQQNDDYITTLADAASAEAHEGKNGGQEVQTFIPPTTRYNQPIRNFPTSVINNSRYQREIIHTLPFHPPKSGAAENMIAHVCEVTCIEHVYWALAELLFNDKKVAKATHNMFAYRFHGEDSTLVHDNDDDGEKGSGAKLASLLEMSGAENVLVVVSRWYGGQLLGSARFKWIAGVARIGLVQGGFIKGD